MNKFPNTNIRYEDTRKAGAITVQGFELVPDKAGCIECPQRLEDDLRTHGFLRVGSAEHEAWKAGKAIPPMPMRVSHGVNAV